MREQGQLDAEFTELYRAHLRDVYCYAYYRVGNHHDAEDLTEQTFLQAYRHFERALARIQRPAAAAVADPHRPQPRCELYRDRSRKPQTHHRGRRGRCATHTTRRTSSRGARSCARCSRASRSLPDDRREALIMRFALGMDNREIARALGRTDGATKVLIHRAIKQLEEIVSAEGAR